MKLYWNEIQPVDRYQVRANGILHDFDRKVVTFLYQPLIGTACFSLYMTFWSKVEENRLWSEEWTHYHLMDFLSVNIRDIYEARLKLEGIGLLKTFIKTDAEERCFIYEIQAPLSPEQFFTDGMLNIYLYRKIGHTHFTRLKRFFSDKTIERQSYTEITRSFQDVFATADHRDLLDGDGEEASQAASDHQYYARHDNEGMVFTAENFDFTLLMAGLQEAIIPNRALTAQVKDAIVKLSYLYNINAIEMKNIILSAITAEQQIDIEELRKAARDWYQMENADALPKLVDHIQPVNERKMIAAPQTKEQQLIHYLETTSPRQLLIDIADGVQPSKGDLAAIEEVAFHQQLPAGVINVLIHYVMLKTDMKLSKNYLEKIASHWSRKKIKTVPDAMALAKAEHRQYQEWAAGKQNQQQKRKKPIRTEKLPDWLKEQELEKERVEPEKVEANELEEKRRKLKAIQNKYRK